MVSAILFEFVRFCVLIILGFLVVLISLCCAVNSRF